MSRGISFIDFQDKVLRPAQGAAWVTRTDAQRVLWAVGIDCLDPVDLPPADRELARQLFGDFERIPPNARGTFALTKGARVAGTLTAAEVLLWCALTVPLPTLAAGEQAFAVAVAPDLKLARQALRYSLGAARSAPTIAARIESSDKDSFVLRRADRRAVSIEVLAAGRGGAALRGRSLVGCVLDEASFFRDADSGVVNDLELYRAVSPRIVPGGKLMVLSTAWMRAGLLHELTDANYGDPKTCVAAIAPSQVLRPNDPQLERVIAESRSRDPVNAEREFDCVPLDGAATSLIGADAIEACVDDTLPVGGAW